MTSSIKKARGLLGNLLEVRGVGRMDTENALMVLHELAANAIDHGAPDEDHTFEVGWTMSESTVEIRVSDSGHAGVISVQPPSLTRNRGRGLAMVEAFSGTWQVERLVRTQVSATCPI